MKGFPLFPSSMSFRPALLVYVVAPLVCLVGLFGYPAWNSIEEQVENRMQKDLELVARAVRLPLSYALEKKQKGQHDAGIRIRVFRRSGLQRSQLMITRV